MRIVGYMLIASVALLGGWPVAASAQILCAPLGDSIICDGPAWDNPIVQQPLGPNRDGGLIYDFEGRMAPYQFLGPREPQRRQDRFGTRQEPRRERFGREPLAPVAPLAPSWDPFRD